MKTNAPENGWGNEFIWRPKWKWIVMTTFRLSGMRLHINKLSSVMTTELAAHCRLVGGRFWFSSLRYPHPPNPPTDTWRTLLLWQRPLKPSCLLVNKLTWRAAGLHCGQLRGEQPTQQVNVSVCECVCFMNERQGSFTWGRFKGSSSSYRFESEIGICFFQLSSNLNNNLWKSMI